MADMDIAVEVVSSTIDVAVEMVGGSSSGVSSVNGQTGVVVLDAGDVGADPAGAADAVTLASLGGVADSDARLTDARTPTAHAATHAAGGSDPITLESIGAASDAEGALAVSAVQPEDLATVATSGAYADLTGTPTVPDPTVAGVPSVGQWVGGIGGELGVFNYAPGTSGAVYVTALPLMSTITVDRVNVRLGVGQPGASLRIAAYRWDGTAWAQAHNFGTVSAASGQDIGPSGTWTLTPGIYLIGVVTDNAAVTIAHFRQPSLVPIGASSAWNAYGGAYPTLDIGTVAAPAASGQLAGDGSNRRPAVALRRSA